MSDIYDIIQSPLNKTLEDKFIFVMNLPNCLKNLKSKYVKDISSAGIGVNSVA
jgi:hypothetical protein